VPNSAVCRDKCFQRPVQQTAYSGRDARKNAGGVYMYGDDHEKEGEFQ
jgi:hypothetical protein